MRNPKVKVDDIIILNHFSMSDGSATVGREYEVVRVYSLEKDGQDGFDFINDDEKLGFAADEYDLWSLA